MYIVYIWHGALIKNPCQLYLCALISLCSSGSNNVAVVAVAVAVVTVAVVAVYCCCCLVSSVLLLPAVNDAAS